MADTVLGDATLINEPWIRRSTFKLYRSHWDHTIKDACSNVTVEYLRKLINTEH